MNSGDYKLSKILNKTGGKCYYCGVPLSGDRSFPGDDRPGAWNVDHLFPDGRNDLANLVPACVVCNSRKGFMEPGDFFRLIGKRAPPNKPRSWTNTLFRFMVIGFAVYGARHFYYTYLKQEHPLAAIGREVQWQLDKATGRGPDFMKWFSF